MTPGLEDEFGDEVFLAVFVEEGEGAFVEFGLGARGGERG